MDLYIIGVTHVIQFSSLMSNFSCCLGNYSNVTVSTRWLAVARDMEDGSRSCAWLHGCIDQIFHTPVASVTGFPPVFLFEWYLDNV